MRTAANRVLPEGQMGVTYRCVKTVTIKLEPEQDTWLEQQARALRRSKGGIIRELISERQAMHGTSVGRKLHDLRGSLKGSRDLSTRPLKGYGRA